MSDKSHKSYKYLFGPVASRRLGRSLGIDIVPLKTCPYDCLYCQLGSGAAATQEREEYVKAELIFKELERWLKQDIELDYLTVSGSGEPTLNCRLGKIIDGIKQLAPENRLAVITNGALLSRPEVRDELSGADVVLPSLDAGDTATFDAMNRPAGGVEFERMLDGLREFSLSFRGEIWLEVFLLSGVNDSDQQIASLKAVVDTISHDRLQLNTLGRPPAEAVKGLSRERLVQIKQLLGDKAEIVAEPPVVRIKQQQAKGAGKPGQVFAAALARRPCSLAELAAAAGVTEAVALEALGQLEAAGEVVKEGEYYLLVKKA
jgi:wyosine [tRNA(Phe)-imidazoG37] synthetase (radical SAM superfamily)